MSDYPPEWPGFALACFNMKKQRPVMVLIEARDLDRFFYVGEVEFPADSHGWLGARPLTRAAREVLAALKESRR